MSKKVIDIPELSEDKSDWESLLNEARSESATSLTLTEEEKRLLDELDRQPEEEWESVTNSGIPTSDLVIEERGER